MDAMDFLPLMREKLKLLDMDEKLMNRSVNESFSGGERSATRSCRWLFCNRSSHSRRNRLGARYRCIANRSAGRERDAQP